MLGQLLRRFRRIEESQMLGNPARGVWSVDLEPLS